MGWLVSREELHTHTLQTTYGEGERPMRDDVWSVETPKPIINHMGN